MFSGDIGHGNKPLIRNPQYIREADYVIMESTYGDRLHQDPPDYAKELAAVCRDTFRRGGNLVIPAFSVGRTQEMLYFLRKIKTEGMLPEFEGFEVYIDSPLAVEATNIFHKNVKECFDEEALELVRKGKNPISFPGLKVSVTSDESKMINFIEKPIVIISASGMCEAGRIRHHLKHNLWRKDSTILFVGYQVPGTLGNLLLSGAKEVRLFGETIEVHANPEPGGNQRPCGPAAPAGMGQGIWGNPKEVLCSPWGGQRLRYLCVAFGKRNGHCGIGALQRGCLRFGIKRLHCPGEPGAEGQEGEGFPCSFQCICKASGGWGTALVRDPQIGREAQ